MRFRNILAAVSATILAVAPVAASTNPAAGLSLAAAQDTNGEVGVANDRGGPGAGTIIGVLFGLAVIVAAIAVGDNADSR